MLGFAMAVSGCAERVYRADKLPLELVARQPVPIDTINLSGLADPPLQTDIICPGDVLEVTMVTDFSKLTTSSTPARVARDGTVEVPLVGRVQVAGMELEQAEQTISTESLARGIFRSPCITVTMKQPRMNKITVVGAVAEPGVQDLPRMSSTLLAALVSAGGLSKEAGPDVEIRRSKPLGARPYGPGGAAEGTLTAHEQPIGGPAGMTFRVNLATAARDQGAPHLLEDGDVVHVLKRDIPPVSVIGLVQKPGGFEYPANRPFYFLDALALAGGISSPVADKVLVIRRPAGQKTPVNIEVSISKAKSGRENIELQPGDTVTVERTPATVVVDSLQTFFRVGFSSALPGF
jgi:polysaccharide export outer membrane protein